MGPLSAAEVLIIGFITYLINIWTDEATTESDKNVESVDLKRQEIQNGGGSDPVMIDAKEYELIVRGATLPSKPRHECDPAMYEAELDKALHDSRHLAKAYEPPNANRYAAPVPGSARSIGTIFSNWLAFKYPRDMPRDPGPYDNQEA